MSEDLRFLGLAKRGNRLAAGEDAVRELLETGRVRLLILAADAGPHTVRWVENRSGDRPVLTLKSGKAELGAALGWQDCGVAAFSDLNMALAFTEKLAERDETYLPIRETLARKRETLERRREKKPGKRTRKHG